MNRAILPTAAAAEDLSVRRRQIADAINYNSMRDSSVLDPKQPIDRYLQCAGEADETDRIWQATTAFIVADRGPIKPGSVGEVALIPMQTFPRLDQSPNKTRHINLIRG